MSRAAETRSVEAIRYDRSNKGRIVVAIAAALLSAGSLTMGLNKTDTRTTGSDQAPSQRTKVTASSSSEPKSFGADPVRPVATAMKDPYEVRTSQSQEIAQQSTVDRTPDGIDADVVAPAPAETYFRSCAEVRAAGRAPILRGQDGYRSGLDRDGDGRACESKPRY
jgi:hypothetical protein